MLLLTKLKTKILIKQEEKKAMIINYYALQIELGWITLKQVPKKYRAKVQELLEFGGALEKDGE